MQTDALTKKAAEVWRDALWASQGTCRDPVKGLEVIRAALASIPTDDLAGMDGLVEAVAELQLAAFLAGRGSTRADGPAPSIDDFRRMAATAIQSLLAQVARLEARLKEPHP